MKQLPLIRIKDFTGGLANYPPIFELKRNEFTNYTGCQLNKLSNKLGALRESESLGIFLEGISDLMYVAGIYTNDDKFWYLVIYNDGTNVRANLYEDGVGWYKTTGWNLGTSTEWSNSKPSVYYVDGVIRISGSHEIEGVLLFYLDSSRTYFQATTKSNGWYVIRNMKIEDIDLIAYGSLPYTSSSWFAIDVNIDSTGSSFISEDIVDYAISIEMADGQETKLLFNKDVTVTITTDGACIEVDLFVNQLQFFGNTGLYHCKYINIYRRINNGDFYLWKKLNVLERTACYDDKDTEILWRDYDSLGDPRSKALSIYDTGVPLTDSYEARTGYYGSIKKSKNDSSTTPNEIVLENDIEWIDRFKASTIAISRAVIANVKIGDIVYNDRAYVSPVDKYDSFPQDRYLTIGIGDGDAITAVSPIGKYMIAFFKHRHLYVVDASSPSEASWTVVKSFENYGTGFPNSIINCEFGLLFCNTIGAYLLTTVLQIINLSVRFNWKSIFQNESDVWAIYDDVYKYYLVSTHNSTTYAVHILHKSVSKRVYTSNNSMKYMFFRGPDGICAGVKDTLSLSPIDFQLHKIDGSTNSLQDSAIQTGPIWLNELKDKYKSINLYFTYATQSGKTVQYGVSNDINTAPSATIALQENTKLKTTKVRYVTISNCLRVAINNFNELTEIGLEVIPLSGRDLISVGGDSTSTGGGGSDTD